MGKQSMVYKCPECGERMKFLTNHAVDSMYECGNTVCGNRKTQGFLIGYRRARAAASPVALPEAMKLLNEAYWAIWTAVADEDGLDGSVYDDLGVRIRHFANIKHDGGE